MEKSSLIWEELLQQGLKEDGWLWDWTTLGTLPRPVKKKPPQAVAKIVSKSHGIWAADAGFKAVERLSENWAEPIHIRARVADGDAINPGDVVGVWRGSARSILALERPFLNLASYAGGIATQAHSLVQKIKQCSVKPLPRLTLTRKTLPHYRDLSIASVLIGGGYPHRVSLSGGVLIKENHIALAGDVQKAILSARALAPHGLMIEAEVRDLKELDLALKAHADGVLLDNFEPLQVKRALDLIGKQHREITVEVSGGINETTIQDYVIPGVHVLSVGSLTHHVRGLDLSLLIK